MTDALRTMTNEKPTEALRFVKRQLNDYVSLHILQQRWCIRTAGLIRYEWRDVPIENGEDIEATHEGERKDEPKVL